MEGDWPTSQEVASFDVLLAAAGGVAICSGDPARGVRSLVLAEDLQELERLEPDTLVLLSAAASTRATDYRLDMALRWVALRGGAGLGITQPTSFQPSVSAREIAQRSAVGLFLIAPGTDMAQLLRKLWRLIDGGPASLLAGAESGLDELEKLGRAGAGHDELCQAATRSSGYRVELREPLPGDYAISAGPTQSHAFCVSQTGPWARQVVARLVVQAIAGIAARADSTRTQQRDAPRRSRRDVLGDLLLADQAHTPELAEWARTLGLAVDGWHAAIRLEVGRGVRQDELQQLELLEEIGEAAEGQANGNEMQLARSLGAVVLIQTLRQEPDQRWASQLTRRVVALLRDLERQFPGVVVKAGIGSWHEGPRGLRTSALEARAAVSRVADLRKGSPLVAAFDSAGIRRMLVEWYSSETAREAVREQLAPLEGLGETRAAVAIETLQAYLDHRCSVVDTARALHLHRNAVAYRLRWIFELLGADPSDPDQRLALHLACRARSLW